MNNLEDRIRTALQAEAATVRPRPGAFEENRRRLRRAVRQRRATIPVLAALSAATVTVGAFVVVKHESPGSPAWPVGPAEPRPVTDITKLASLSSVVTISGRVSDGADYQVEALGTDGSVLGRSPDSTVWQADGSRPRPTSLGVRADGGLATGPGFRTWATPGRLRLKCRSEPEGRVKTITPDTNDPWPEAGFWSSGQMLAWHDGMMQPYATRACDPARFLNIPIASINHVGEIVALSGTDLFSTNPTNNKNLQEIDLSTRRLKALHPLPAGVPRFSFPPQPDLTESCERTAGGGTMCRVGPLKGSVPNWDTVHLWSAAATSDVFAWAAGGRLRVTDRQTWRHTTTLPTRPPAPAQRTRAVMTAGDHLVAYTAKTATQGWKSVLYNTRTGNTIAIPGKAYAAGDYLLWRQGTNYRLAQVDE